MKINIKTTKIKLDLKLKQFIEEKIGELEKFCNIFQSEKYFDTFFTKRKPGSEAWIELEKTTRHHQKGPFFSTKCQIRLPGKILRSEVVSENLKQAIIEVKDELKKELRQYKEKQMALIKRGARVFKKELRLSSAARFYRKGRIREEGV